MYVITMHIPRVLSPVLIPVDVVRQVPVTAVPENGWLPTCAGENKQLHLYVVHILIMLLIANTILHVLSKTLEPI